MSRYKHLLENLVISNEEKVFGLFPFNSIVNQSLTNVYSGKIEFDPSAIEGIKILASKGYKVVIFINQFKNRPLSFEHFQSLNAAVENFIVGLGMKVDGLYWCPGIDKKDPYVVPNPGMFHKATENQNLVWENVPVISSFDQDLSAAEKVKAVPIKIGNGSNKWTHFESFIDWANSLN